MTVGRRTYGYLYDRNRLVKDDAALMRRHIKTLVGNGVLPGDWKYSVRYRTFAGGCSIDVTATSPRPIHMMQPERVFGGRDGVVIERVPVAPRDRDEHGLWWQNMTVLAGDFYEIRWCDSITCEAKYVSDLLDDLHGAFNHDGSDSQVDHFDVKFYGRAVLDTVPGVGLFEEAHRLV